MNAVHKITQTKNFKKNAVIIFFALSAVIWLGTKIYNYFYVSTDDAYVNANVVQIAPRVTGAVSQLFIKNNQYVKAGEPLFEIDKVPFEVAINSAKAELALSMAALENAAITQKRTSSLVQRRFLSAQDGDNALANLKTAQAKVEHAKAMLEQANLNLSYTHILAPSSGWVTNVTLRVGDMVPANQPLFVLISDHEFWADANFKETEMADIHPGQAASIMTDLYPNHPFRGVVESISGGAGAAFSLLPPQNATGNWVKVTQRIPVRIHILNPDPKYPLRIGISSTVTVNLRSSVISSPRT